MEITQLQESLPYLFKARVTPFVWGTHGIGKSESIRQFAERNGHGFVDIRLGTQDVGDLLGLADFETDSKGNKVATKFMMPDWIKQVIQFCEKNPDKYYVIFLDEFNRARRDVLQAVFQLVLDGMFHTTKLPSNCRVVAAGNPNTDGYIVTDVGDEALMDRFCHIKLRPSVREWLDYAEVTGFNKDLTGFIRAQNKLLDNNVTDGEWFTVTPSRRSWGAVNRLLSVELPEILYMEVLGGLVGRPATIAFVEHVKNSDKPIPVRELLKNYEKHREKVESFCSATSSREDILKVQNEEFVKYFEDNEKNGKKMTAKEVKNFLSYLKVLPLDILFSFVRDIYITHEEVREAIATENDWFEDRLGQADTAGIKKKLEATTSEAEKSA